MTGEGKEDGVTGEGKEEGVTGEGKEDGVTGGEERKVWQVKERRCDR